MRRTYKSKKETANVIERRDLFQNLDGKSTAYDAFSIQNIKQTKRELSCVGSSNPIGAAARRVRKKKYVKRIVKEPETPCQKSMSQSAYLTPDKSIRVNKPLDPFDLLLISSPACSRTPVVKNIETLTSQVNLFDHLVPKKEGKCYTRKKPKRSKKLNSSSSDSSDSDKENSDERLNTTQNTSDIRYHKLLVEEEPTTTPNKVNDSINNIVNNISLLNKLKQNKHKYNSNDSINKSLRINRHRLTKTLQTPMLQTSPLCSTPFKVKYRGDSIFVFSPIAVTSEESLKYNTMTEDNDDNNSSIILCSKGKKDSPKTTEENCNVSTENKALIDSIEYVTSVANLNPEKDINLEEEVMNGNTSAVNIACNNSIEYDTSVVNLHLETERNEAKITEEKYQEAKTSSNLFSDNSIPCVDLSSYQTTEHEEFLGFSKNTSNEVVAETKKLINISLLNDTTSEHELTQIENEYSQDYNAVQEKINIETEANDNSKYYKSDDQRDTANDINDETDSDYVKSSQSESDDKESFYDTCTSDQSSIQYQEDKVKEPVVLLEKMNDSSFFRYYDQIKSDSTGTDGNESSKSEFASLEDSNEAKQSYESSDLESDAENNDSVKDEDEETDSNNGESSSNNGEEKCISFVTTRRRNEVTNNSMISIFNDSYCSSSTDCDKTVLSNKDNQKSGIKRDSCIDKNDTLIDININKDDNEGTCEVIDLNKDSEHSDDATSEHEPRISFVTTRSSNINRKSSMKPRNSSTKCRDSTISKQSSILPRESIMDTDSSMMSCFDSKPAIVLQPGKKWERSLSIYRRMTMMTDHYDHSMIEAETTKNKGRKYRQSVISTMEMQDLNNSLNNELINSRRSTFISKPSRSTIRILKDADNSRLSLCNTTVYDDLTGFLNEECDDTIIELSKLSIADQTHEVTVLNNFHDTSNRIATARDYVLRRCNQPDSILFDECYPDVVLKNCHKIGEGVYGEVFLWRDRDGRARVLKIVPIAGSLKVNGECQKDFHEIISEIVIAMELSALRAPIAEIERHLDEGKDVEALDLHAIENATDVFNEVLAVRCVYGSYPSRLLDLWDLYDECKGSENDNPAILPVDQQYMVLELANAGQDLESYQFNNAEQAYALFLQVAYGLAVAEEAFQFEHRDLHWGNVLIAPTEQKFATFVLRGRPYRVARRGVAATVIDYSLSRVALRLGGEPAALYNDLAGDDSLFDAVGDYQFQVYRLMRDKLGNDWKNYEPYTNILWLHYTVDKMITALRYKRTNTKIHKHYIDKLKAIKSRILDYGSAALFVLTDNEI